MPAFQLPIPRDNYCRKHGSSYAGSVCPECVSDREKEAKYRVCPFCQETRIVNTKYVYCVNSKCSRYFIIFLKEEFIIKPGLPKEPLSGDFYKRRRETFSNPLSSYEVR